jgi:hypothetical protein
MRLFEELEDLAQQVNKMEDRFSRELVLSRPPIIMDKDDKWIMNARIDHQQEGLTIYLPDNRKNILECLCVSCIRKWHPELEIGAPKYFYEGVSEKERKGYVGLYTPM